MHTKTRNAENEHEKKPATNINKERTAHKYEEKHEQIKRDGAKEKHVVLQHQLQLQLQ